MTNWFQTAGISPIYGRGPTRRWIVQGGPAIPDDASSPSVTSQMQTLIRAARRAHCTYIELRCFADYSRYHQAILDAGFTFVPHYDITIAPLAPSSSQDSLPDWIHESKRRQIRHAIEEGQTWRETQQTDDIRAWYSCLRALYRTKVRRPIPPLHFFLDMVQHHGCHLLVVELHQHIIGGVLLPADANTAYEWYLCGQVMSTWAAIEWCRQHHISTFDTMGAGEPGIPYGVRDFKLQMGGTLHNYGRYRYILRPTLYRLGECAIRLLSKRK